MAQWLGEVGGGAARGRRRRIPIIVTCLVVSCVIGTDGSSPMQRRPWSIGARSAASAGRGGISGGRRPFGLSGDRRPCGFSLPPSHRSRETSTATSSPIVASLFFQWKRRPRRSLLPAPRGMPVRDDAAATTSSYLDTLSVEPDLHLVEHSAISAGLGDSLQIEAVRGGAATVLGGEEALNTENVVEVTTLEEQPAANNNDDVADPDDEDKTIVIHTYTHTLPNATATDANNAIFHVHNNLTLMGVGMPSRQFAAWVQYYLSHMSQDGDAKPRKGPAAKSGPGMEEDQILQKIATEEVDWESEWDAHLPAIRQYWKEGRLLIEHTSLLSSHGRPKEGGEELSNANGENEREKLDNEELKRRQEEEEMQIKSEQFRDALGSYADRLASIVEDERSDVHFLSSKAKESAKPFNFGEVIDLPQRQEWASADSLKMQQPHHLPKWTSRSGLRGWLEHEYGVEKTQQLLSDNLLKKSEKEQLKAFQSLLDWFRSSFPYFHDKCDHCGASCKDDPSPLSEGDSDEVNTIRSDADILNSNGQSEEQLDGGNEGEDDFSFLGYVYPTSSERLGNATRTELYRCRSCSSFTRFPRYNKALWVTSTKQGRCGEYSMLLYRMLRVLGYDKIRWVVDWSDHVWVEVWLGDAVHKSSENGRWVHLDPCEAAVDNPLLYESWGKNQTFIVAFHDPFYSSSREQETVTGGTEKSRDGTEAAPPPQYVMVVEGKNHSSVFPPVEDITRQYTSDEAQVIRERRGMAEEPVAEAIDEVSRNMVQLLHQKMAQP